MSNMRGIQLLNVKRSQAKTKNYKKLLQEMGNNVVFLTERYRLMMNEFEIDIVLACCDALKYFLFVLVVLYICAIW
ncbi:hypothetical protein HW132_00010 [Brasilonema sp. CT11]|nr:hypothetical protein [Brasilonema sp. CT11]